MSDRIGKRRAAASRGAEGSVGRVCNRDVVAVAPTTSITDAAAAMRARHVGSVLVVDGRDGDRPIGIVTDRDIVIEVIALKLDVDTLTVGDLVASSLVTVNESETCEDAARLMALHAVRRMPVVDDAGRLVGVLALDDLLPFFTTPLANLAQLVARNRAREVGRRV